MRSQKNGRNRGGVCILQRIMFLNDLKFLIVNRLNSVEQNLTKKLDSVETKRKKEVEKFNVEKEKVLSEHHEVEST